MNYKQYKYFTILDNPESDFSVNIDLVQYNFRVVKSKNSVIIDVIDSNKNVLCHGRKLVSGLDLFKRYNAIPFSLYCDNININDIAKIKFYVG